MAEIKIKRAYDPAGPADGFRILVDRLWPRGISKEKLAAGLWLKSAAPSTGLRLWFGHDPARWDEFRSRYLAELNGSPGWEELKVTVKEHPAVTLVYGARDERHNEAVVLKDLLEKENG